MELPQQKRPLARALRCFQEMCGLVPVSISPLILWIWVVERWPLREAIAARLVGSCWLGFVAHLGCPEIAGADWGKLVVAHGLFISWLHSKYKISDRG